MALPMPLALPVRMATRREDMDGYERESLAVVRTIYIQVHA
jgi:hypothetical protein